MQELPQLEAKHAQQLEEPQLPRRGHAARGAGGACTGRQNEWRSSVRVVSKSWKLRQEQRPSEERSSKRSSSCECEPKRHTRRSSRGRRSEHGSWSPCRNSSRRTRRMKVCGTWFRRGSATSTKHLTMSDAFRSEKLGTLTGEYEQAVVGLRETQERLRDEWEDRRFCHRRAESLQVRLQDSHEEHDCLQASNNDFVQETRFQVETRELVRRG